MKTSVSAKRCPACGKATTLQAALCSHCGHLFRTRFVEAVERTQAVDVVLLPQQEARPLRRGSLITTFHLAFLSSFLLVVCTGAILWLVWNTSHPAVKSRQVSALPSASTVPDQADHLYNKITMGMSLYDLDQAAGGTGRVIHGSNVHTLQLSYDYPKQRVQVWLSRTDVTDNDFVVQAVALYQGKAILLRHADIN